MRSTVGAEPPEVDGIEAILADLDRVIAPGLTLTLHPRFFGWFPANASLLTVYASPQAHSSVTKAALLAGFGLDNLRLVEVATPCRRRPSRRRRRRTWPQRMGTILDCSLLYVRDPQHLIRVMSTNPSYLRSPVDDEVTQLKDWGIPLGWRFRALKIWFQLCIDGVEEITGRLRRDLRHARWLAEQVQATPNWMVVAPVTLQTICVRHEPVGVDGAPLDAVALDAQTQRWAAALNASGRAFVTSAQLDGRWMVRISIGAVATEEADVAAGWAALQDAAAAAAPAAI